MDIREKYKQYIAPHNAAIIFYLILFIMSCVVIMFKENYHNDEYFSYGSANNISEDGTGRMNPQLAPYTYSPAGDALYEYLAVQEGDPFDLKHVWDNQASDVHPPLYYLCLYILSYVWKGTFTKWTGGCINILFLLFSLIAVRKLSEVLGHPKWETNLISLFFVLSPGILMQAAFFRMYVMAMCEMTWMTYLLIKYKGHERRRFYILLSVLSVVGALTHYYCLIYMFFISVFYCLSLLIHRRFVPMCKYVAAMACAGVISCAIFPAIIRHIFGGGYRGKQSFENLWADIDLFWERLEFFFEKVDGLLFGGIGLVLGFGALCMAVYLFRAKGIAETLKSSHYLRGNAIYMLAAVCYFLLITKIAVGHTERYIYPIYGVMITGGLGGIVAMAGQYMSKSEGGGAKADSRAYCDYVVPQRKKLRMGLLLL